MWTIPLLSVEAHKGQHLTSLTNQSAVSIRDEGFVCRIRVEGVDIAGQILACLSNAFVFKTSEPMEESYGPSGCTFRVAYGSQSSCRKLVGLLSAIPGVGLQLEPPCGETDLRETRDE